MTLEFEYPFKNEVLLVVEIDNPKFDNNGIGSYEFWGKKGYDKGSDYVEDFKISSITSETYKGKEVKIKDSFFDDIKEYIFNNESLMQKVNEYFCEEDEYDYENDCRD